MLVCPVCRSQNMDSAKFCGNCGNPFPRQSDQTSSLISCAQGHVYSAIYQYCPYCPQPESNDPSSFITRVEEAVTALNPPGADTVQPFSNQIDYATRVDAAETLFESPESPEPPEPPEPMDTQTGVRTVSQPILAPTEMISPVYPVEPMGEAITMTETVSEIPTIEVRPSPLITGSPEPDPPPSPPLPIESIGARSPAPEPERRTIVMAEKSPLAQELRGKIFGWLITFTRNPDGEDFRLYAGYNRLGANPVCDVVLADETVSGSHAIIVCRDGRCVIKDDLSRNGTFVNGREITEAHLLQSYDEVRIGNTYLTFVAAQRS